MKKLLTAALAALFATTCALPALADVAVSYTDLINNKVTTKTVTPSDPLPMRGQTTPVGATFTTPAGVSGYSTGQLIANSGTAGSVVPMSFQACLVNGGNGAIVGVRIKTADTGFAGKKVILKLHRDAPTYTNGDHGTWLTTESNALPPTSITLSEHYSDFEKGFGVPDNNGTVNGRSLFGFDCASGSQLIYGELVAGEAITPQGAKAFTAVLEVAH